MRYTIVWETSALNTFKQLKASDPHAAKIIASAVNALAKNPEPAGSVKVSPNVRRLRVDTYKITYRIDGDRIAVTVLMVGKSRP